jgi:hypothetical protein
LDTAAERKNGTYVQACNPLDFVEMLQVLGVGHRHTDRVAHLEQRNCVEALGNLARQQSNRNWIDHAVAKPHGRYAQMLFNKWQDRVFLHHAHFDEHLAEPQAFLRTLGER